MNDINYIEANKIAWSEVNTLHQEFKEKYKEKFIQDKDFVAIDEKLLQTMNRLNFANKSILHVCCNDGEELISLKKKGAGKCVGVDLSIDAITSAIELNEKLQLDCKFHTENVYNIENHISETFDFVLITVGALVWLPDLDKLFSTLSNFMHAGSQLVIQEQHPFSWIIDEEMKLSKTDLYFKKGPYKEKGGLDYLGNKEYEGSDNYTFNYTLGELFNLQIKHGLNIQSFEEFPFDISNLKSDIEKEDAAFPLSYICISKKQ
ncbi:class I SAM-dependent methyltransferase [Tenacibaculum sp. 190524A02b]|uniref:Methyltranfer_dom domain-containing protein n=1 Tax=Tenacibaculum vairaonense TaxID=3137860 RepID=A0ABP1FE52_9FLAO